MLGLKEIIYLKGTLKLKGCDWPARTRLGVYTVLGDVRWELSNVFWESVWALDGEENGGGSLRTNCPMMGPWSECFGDVSLGLVDM